ncbi:hypothetical protein [Nonomuraea endophytica]|uniref:Uncharacterized protein n=1 Tax=Nonomuraea endophytica TaxID=714136 RepID=A0A7W8A8E4_9ACTN|nr:hypothetical protein [Nonomuraea endophytica]MBB5081517.1 hypothetical protein [Nonomuraea endophytica]
MGPPPRRPPELAHGRAAPYLLPIALFVYLPDLIGVVTNRAGDMGMITNVWPGLFVWTAAVLAAVTTILTRLITRGRLRPQA